MDAQSYSTALADLRTLRDQIKKTRAVLVKQETDRDKLITKLASYEKAKAERIASAAGLGLADVVTLVPALAPDSLAVNNAPQPQPLEPPTDQATADVAPPPPQHATAPAMTTASARPAPASAQAPVSEPPAAPGTPRDLPSVPAGTSGDAWFCHASALASTRPNFTQQARSTVFLDTSTGVLVHRDQTHHLDLGTASAAEILTAVFHTIPEGTDLHHRRRPLAPRLGTLPLPARRRRRLAQCPHPGLAHRHRPWPRQDGRALRPRPPSRRPLPA